MAVESDARECPLIASNEAAALYRENESRHCELSIVPGTVLNTVEIEIVQRDVGCLSLVVSLRHKTSLQRNTREPPKTADRRS
jgi:hypothetical protein